MADWSNADEYSASCPVDDALGRLVADIPCAPGDALDEEQLPLIGALNERLDDLFGGPWKRP